MELVDERRVIAVNGMEPGRGGVVYWMSRDQRVHDNWALLYALQLALEKKAPLAVIFVLVPSFLHAAERQYRFMLKGLRKLAATLKEQGIAFHLLSGSPPEVLEAFCRRHGIGTVVSDFDPLRIKQEWKQAFAARTETALFTVDAHNIVPAFLASNKQEFGAYTLRPKLKRLIPAFLHPYPKIPDVSKAQHFPHAEVDWEAVEGGLSYESQVPELEWIQPGEQAARECMQDFIQSRLDHYASGKNDPNKAVVSDLSPYLHFGQLSSQTLALEVMKGGREDENTQSYLEELIVRKELSDNYCLYNARYDQWEGLPEWSRKTLQEHWRDEREYLYTLEAFESAQTHDPLWNAAQIEMAVHGKMHGYLRMYWAKKILEWTPDPKKALEICLFLNDKYELDGRDPNGYAGCAWSVGGLHDRAWGERPVFGKIRYMNDKGCRRKFDVDAYIRKWDPQGFSLTYL